MAKMELNQASKDALSTLWLAGYTVDEIFQAYPQVSAEYRSVIAEYMLALNILWINHMVQVKKSDTTGIYGISINPPVKE